MEAIGVKECCKIFRSDLPADIKEKVCELHTSCLDCLYNFSRAKK